MGLVNIIGITISSGRGVTGLSKDLLTKFLYLWTGKYNGDDLLSDLSTDVITVTDKDWITKVIPELSEATFRVPGTVTYLEADDGEIFWFQDPEDEGTADQKTFTELIESTTLRTFVKYTDFEPYEISAIGILKAAAVLTEADKIELNRYFKLWTQYWGFTMMESGYMKDNRILLEGFDDVVIGTQTWKGANVSDNITDSRIYDDDEDNRAIYGGLYSWDMIGAIEALYPGYHVPTALDMITLNGYLSSTYGASGWGAMKESGTEHWDTPNTGGTNDTNFRLLPGGLYDTSQTDYFNIGATGQFWSVIEDGDNAWVYGAVSTTANAAPASAPKEDFYSIRLIKDAAPS